MMRVKAIPTFLMAAALFVSACGGSNPPPAAQLPATTQAGSSSASPATSTPASAIVAAGAPTPTAGAVKPPVGSAGGPTVAPIDKAALVPGGFGNVDTCKLVTKVEAKAALGGMLGVTNLDTAVVHTQVLDSVSDGSFSETCMYNFALQKDGLDLAPDQGGKVGTLLIQYYPLGGANWFKHQHSGSDKALSGLGDQAFTTGPSMVVLKGDSGVMMGMTGPNMPLQPIPEADYRILVQKAVDRLPAQASGPPPALPKVAPPKATVAAAAVPTQAPTVAAAAIPTVNPAVTTFSATIQAALVAAQGGDLAKARAAFQPATKQWAAIPNDGKLITADLYPKIGDAIKQTGDLLASPDTDAAAAATALSDLSDGVTVALETANAAAAAASVMPQVSADMATAVAAPTPIVEGVDKNPACILITKAEASALLGGNADVQPIPSFTAERHCQYFWSQTIGNVSKGSLIQVELHPTDGASWYVDNAQRMGTTSSGYRSGSDIGDQWFAMGAQQIWVLKGDSAMAITMPVFTDVSGTPIDEMKGLASKAAARMH